MIENQQPKSAESVAENKVAIINPEAKTPELFKEFLDIDKQIFPDMEIEEDELRETFESGGIQVALRDPQNKLIGYLLSVPYEEAINFLSSDDTDLTPKEKTLYIETIGILKEHRSVKNVLAIWNALKEKAIQDGYKTINGHFRVSEGLSQVVQKRLKGKYFRTMENWSDFGEPFDYIEIDLLGDGD